MAQNPINARFSLKYDTLKSWQDNNPLLLEGEVAFAVISEANAANKQHPPVMFKVGPGNFNDLDWAAALAADVYSWAKQSSLTVSKNGSGNVVASISWDASLNDGKGGLKYETASVATAEGLESLQNELTALTNTVNGMYTNSQIDAAIKVVADDLAEHEEEFATFQETVNADAIADAKKAGTEAADALNAYKGEVTTALNGKVDTSTYTTDKQALDAKDSELDTAVKAAQADATAAKEAIEAFLDENAATDDVVNTLKEIQAELDAGDASAAALLADINKIKDGSTVVAKATDADTVDGKHASDFDAAGAAASAQAAAEAKVTALADGAVKDNADAIAAINNADTGILKQAKDYADGLAGDYDAKGSAAAAQAAAEGYADNLNTAMDARVTELENGTSIYNVDEVSTTATGAVTYLYFNCGSASTLID